MSRFITTCMVLMLPIALFAQVSDAGFKLTSNAAFNEDEGLYVSDNGAFKISWMVHSDDPEIEGDVPLSDATLVIEEATDLEFSDATVLYQGGDESTTISGRRDGTWYYRARIGEQPWTETVTVSVRHKDLTQAFILLGIGAIVFLSTAGLIIGGHLTHRKEMRGEA